MKLFFTFLYFFTLLIYLDSPPFLLAGSLHFVKGRTILKILSSLSGILYLHFLDLETPLDENLRYELDSVRNQIYTTSDRLWSDLMNSLK